MNNHKNNTSNTYPKKEKHQEEPNEVKVTNDSPKQTEKQTTPHTK